MGTCVYLLRPTLFVAALLLVIVPHPTHGFFGKLVDKAEAILDDVDDPATGRKETRNSSNSESTSSDGKYQVFRAVPKNADELLMLNSLYHMSSELQLNFWKSPTAVGQFADVMVSPESANATREYLEQHNIDFKVIIEDVQHMILQREKPAPLWPSQKNSSASSLLSSFFSKRLRDDATGTRNRAVYGFGEYHSYNEIVRWMEEIERYYPQMARVFTMGSTYEGRQIKGIKIGYPIGEFNKRAVWIDGGMHAREWASIHTALYFIDQLIGLYEVDPQITAYVQTLNFYIIPVANPDGRGFGGRIVADKFVEKIAGAGISAAEAWTSIEISTSIGESMFPEVGSSNDLCSDIFQGTSAFSEPEARAIRDKILSPELNGKLDAFITLHTYSQMWIHPWNHERRTFPDDVQDLQSVGRQGVAALESVYGTRYKFGTGADILYPSSGGSDDWAKAHAHVKYVYLLELRPGEQEWDGFLLDKRQLIPTGRETWEGVKKVVDAVMRAAPKPNSPIAVSATFTAPQSPVEQAPVIQPRLISSNPIQISSRRLIAAQQPQQDNRDAADTQTAQFLRDSLHERLTRLRTQQQQAWQQYERNLQQAEQQRQAAFWQRNQLNGQCSDRSPWCSKWLSMSPNICQSSTVYMTSECRLTCGFCSR